MLPGGQRDVLQIGSEPDIPLECLKPRGQAANPLPKCSILHSAHGLLTTNPNIARNDQNMTQYLCTHTHTYSHTGTRSTSTHTSRTNTVHLSSCCAVRSYLDAILHTVAVLRRLVPPRFTVNRIFVV